MKEANINNLLKFMQVGISGMYITLSIFNFFNPGMKLINNNVVNNILFTVSLIFLFYYLFKVIFDTKCALDKKILKITSSFLSILIILIVFAFSFFVLPKFNKIKVEEANNADYDFDLNNSIFNKTLISTENTYKSDNVSVELSKYKIDKNTVSVADIYIRNLNNIQTAFSSDVFQKEAKTKEILDIAKKNNAICAINGDFCTLNDAGLVIRNGIVYRDGVEGDVCLLLNNGELKTYSEEEFKNAKIDYSDVYQSWNFGPMLLGSDGTVLENFNCEEYIKRKHPRTAIGYVAPGHYKFFVVDGRNDDTSGATLEELAKYTHDFGCVQAYNLDGGASSFITLNDKIFNDPVEYNFDGGNIRKISDIIFITDN